MELPAFEAPFDWDRVDDITRTSGGAIARQLIAPDLVERFNAEVDEFLAADPDLAKPHSGSGSYDRFLGHRTARLHGLCAKFASAPQLIAHPDIVGWVNRMLDPVSASHLLNAGELIQIGPGEPAQPIHRDTDSWPNLARGGSDLLVLNAIVALSPFTAQSGATVVAPDSHDWDEGRLPAADETTQAMMQPGDVLLFRGDLLHGGGANTTVNEHRRAVSFSYCAGWLRTVENSFLTVPLEVAATLSSEMQELLGYRAHNGLHRGAGMLGLYENGDPSVVLERS